MAPTCERPQASRRVRRTRATSRWLPNVIDPSTLPMPRYRNGESRRTLRRSCRLRYRPRAVNPRERVNYRRQEGFDSLRNDPLQLAKIYCGVRRQHARRENANRVTISILAGNRSRRHRKQILAVAGELVHDVVEAVCLQPFLQSLQDRIKSIPISDRPMPTSLDPHVLGLELKIRLAATSPEIRCHFNPKLGTYYVRERHRGTRYVALYEVDDEDDFFLQCSLRVCECGRH